MDRPETYKKDFFDKFHIPRWEELPAIDLYMDQVISFTYASLGEFFDSACISPLTKSMVNNYVKARIKLIDIGLSLPDNPVTYDRFCEAVERAVDAVFSGSIHVEDVKEAGRERRYLVDNFALSFACKIYVQYAINK